MSETRRAVITVANKDGVAELAASLLGQGFELIVSTGTREHLESEKVGPKDRIMPIRTYATIAARTKRIFEHEEATNLLAGRIAAGLETSIELVVCNFTKHRLSDDKKGIVGDIGGPNLAYAAAMSGVITVVNPNDYGELLEVLSCSSEVDLEAFRNLRVSRVLAAVANNARNIITDFRSVAIYKSVPGHLESAA